MLATPVTPLSVITAETADLLPQLLAVGGVAIAVGAGVLVLKRGWRFFKGLSN